MYFATFKNYNGAGVKYKVNTFKSQDLDELREFESKETQYHANLPGNGYCIMIDETPIYNDLKFTEELIIEKLRRQIKPKVVADLYGRKTKFQKETAKELKSFDFSNFKFNQKAFIKACNTEVLEDHTNVDFEKEIDEKTKDLMSFLIRVQNKIVTFDQYKIL
jgi:hypothetical protein